MCATLDAFGAPLLDSHPTESVSARFTFGKEPSLGNGMFRPDRWQSCTPHVQSCTSQVGQHPRSTFRHTAYCLRVAFFLLMASLTVPGFEAQLSFAQDDRFKTFENDVRPLLLERCVKCHGAKKSESGLRLDTRAMLLKGGDSGPAIMPGDPEAGLLIKAIRHTGDLKMPPDNRLAQHEIDAIAMWIKDGAAWPDGMTLGSGGASIRGGAISASEKSFWSFQAIKDPKPPRVSGPTAIHNAIDEFAVARLNLAGLEQRGPADKRTLIRRATFDLTGLPPTPDEVSAFLSDTSDTAFAKVVDRLLLSTAYGERWGRHWLDVVRYADTAGETGDYPTPLSYKYRNWVINAFNADKPYDAFIREQIAGDIIAKQTPGISRSDYAELMTATGFIAISRRFGFDPENYHHLTIQDTIDTLGQAVLGLSLGCARCHDHKYDPVNTEDYYSWYGIFESTRYSFPGSEQKKRPYDLFPAVPPEIAAQQKSAFEAESAKLNGEIKRLEEEQSEVQAGVQAASDGTRKPGGKPLDTVVINPWQAYLNRRRLTLKRTDPDGRMGLQVWQPMGQDLPIVAFNTSDKTLLIPGTVPPKTLVVHPLPKDGIGIAWSSPMTGRVRITGHVKDAHDCGDSVAWNIDHLSEEGLLALAEGKIERRGMQSFSTTNKAKLESVSVRSGEFVQLVVLPKSNHGCDLTAVEFQIDEVGGQKRSWNLVSDVGSNFVASNPHADRFGNPATWFYYTAAADRSTGWSVGKSMKPRIVNVAMDRLRLAAIEQELKPLIERRNKLKATAPSEFIYGAVELDKPRNAQVRIRGDRIKLGKEVPRRNLEILGHDPLPTNAGSGRMQLADWVSRPSNPLMARVMVNRIWQQHFGRGIVGTENDFGARGERPSHPELLDWLATRFRESGWSIKAMHRLIMGSASYQQASDFNAIADRQDPTARLLWRFNRRRLSAEEIRDAMLLVSGELDPSMGGPHPFPAVTTWGFSQHAPYYGVYPTRRRSVYLMQQRLKRHPFLALFDGADPNVSTARRQLTTVPTQSLFLMNNEFVHQRATVIAERLLESDVGTDTDRVKWVFMKAFGRPNTDSELSESIEFLTAYRTALAEASMPERARESAAWSGFARTILTRNEFLFVD